MFLSLNKDIRKGRRSFFQFPANGQKTRSNGKKSNSSNIMLVNFYSYIYKKYFNYLYHVNSKIFFKAYFMNKLFLFNWPIEWIESKITAFKLINKKSYKVLFNLEKASKGHIVGYKRTGASSRRGKSRSKITSVSVGMPLNMLNCFVFKKTKYFKYENTTK